MERSSVNYYVLNHATLKQMTCAGTGDALTGGCFLARIQRRILFLSRVVLRTIYPGSRLFFLLCT